MLYVGIDDTDTLGEPGTNQLARLIVRQLSGRYAGRRIVRHQLLDDARVPYTSKNGCASILLDPVQASPAAELIDELRRTILNWCPRGSDPGLCVATDVPSAVLHFGRICQSELVSQQQARELAAQCGIHLEGLGGTEDGIIGALAAVGLAATGDDGRVVHLGDVDEDFYDIAGPQAVDRLRRLGIAQVRSVPSGEVVEGGLVDVGKRLRPNLRGGKVVLFVTPAPAPAVSEAHWQAVRMP